MKWFLWFCWVIFIMCVIFFSKCKGDTFVMSIFLTIMVATLIEYFSEDLK